MRILVFLIVRLVNVAADAMTLLLIVRAILSWFPGVRLPAALGNFLFNVTEAVLSPIRSLMYKIRFFRDCPIDLSFLAAFGLLSILQALMNGLLRLVL